MGFLDKIKKTVSGNPDKAGGVIDKVGDVIDDKTGGKYSDKIKGAASKAKDAIGKLDDK